MSIQQIIKKYSSAPIIFQIVIIVLFLSLVFIWPTNAKSENTLEKKEVLGVAKNVEPSPTAAATITPTRAPRKTQVATPTTKPTSITPTQAPNQNTNSQSSPTNTPTPAQASTPTPTQEPTPTPTQVPSGLEIKININYADQRQSDSYTVVVEPGQKAWDAIIKAIGISNLTYTDYGGELGIFITGFNGVAAAGNQYYEFRVNGESSTVGVSAYICNKGDKLDFVLTTF